MDRNLDLNTYQTETDTYDGEPLPPATINTSKITVHFRHLAERVMEYIGDADLVLGCVAWLTHVGILNALSKKDAALVVQKEDFLRPDLSATGFWKRELQNRYAAIKCSPTRYDFPGLISSLNTMMLYQTVDGVRCVGNYNRDKHPAFPRMHNKFLVFCRTRVRKSQPTFRAWGDTGTIITPYAVWTGSFNFTNNAVRSLENALYLTNRTIARAYYDEFSHIYSLSEPLDWTKDWCEPEYRIGT